MTNRNTIKFSDYLEKEKRNDPTLTKMMKKEEQKLDYAVAVMELRTSLGLTQEEFAKTVNKPQSTIARIENGNANPTIKTLEQIADSVGKQLTFSFV
ncbi:helix-turn-helix transcriptional regulator [Tetragenococcus halophilus]|uniref:helix-turn-helix domain-containing protein n=1 Tax=Tetragenococcus halophilus TaxID=51669 RepID=UPI000B9261BD|nr:helix-turn-helix transcriptional regulator [Tetragenococcus halophilus]MCO8285316.1 helix-turn-helix transcriptional regulator [Tetragenococcus halophilus]NRR75695.1 helix-turn-helix transcriptional regulator [Tetragenococcus halophilus]QXN87253.1 helix-turn-helix transcriptional regulator [Tetragenococcus halophilus]GBD66977.1 putative Xre family DNA-binding protein [Tetragenococcus halophilus subsp. halophilus]GBD73898.1 putative Xre family DNA-binding protein [Tetragenococcus halophilus 